MLATGYCKWLHVLQISAVQFEKALNAYTDLPVISNPLEFHCSQDRCVSQTMRKLACQSYYYRSQLILSSFKAALWMNEWLSKRSSSVEKMRRKVQLGTSLLRSFYEIRIKSISSSSYGFILCLAQLLNTCVCVKEHQTLQQVTLILILKFYYLS